MKIISEHDYKIIKICKSGEPIIEKLQEYLKNEYLGNISYLNMYDLYKHLAGTVVNVLDKRSIEIILTQEIPNISIRKFFNRKEKNIDETDLCNVMINNLELLKMRENNTDIYGIKKDGKILKYDEYDQLYKGEDAPKRNLMVDMDDVIVTNYFLAYINKYMNTNYVEADFNDFYMQKVIPENLRRDFFEYFLSNDIYKYAIISENAKEVLEELNEKYNLFIGTSYIFPEAIDKSGIVLKQKHEFLIDNFPYLNPHNFILGSNKEVLNMDIKIDDKIDNLKNAKVKLLYTAYHNENLSNIFLKQNNITRVEDFNDIKKLLLK